MVSTKEYKVGETFELADFPNTVFVVTAINGYEIKYESIDK